MVCAEYDTLNVYYLTKFKWVGGILKGPSFQFCPRLQQAYIGGFCYLFIG